MQLSPDQRKILTAMYENAGVNSFVDDTQIVEWTGLDLQPVRDNLDELAEKGLTRASNTHDGHAAMLTGKGRLALSQ